MWVGGVGLQIVREALLVEAQGQALAQGVEDGPNPVVDRVMRLRLIEFAQWVWDEFAISVSRPAILRPSVC